MSHFVDSIKAMGAAAHHSTDQSEHMHMRAAKNPYRRSNRRDFMGQVVQRLDMSERITEHDEFLQWEELRDSVPSYPKVIPGDVEED